MFCQIHRWRLQRSLDGGTLPGRVTRAHMDCCPACKARWAGWQHADAALRNAPQTLLAAPPGFAVRVWAVARAPQEGGLRRASLSPFHAPPAPVLRLAAVVSLLAVLIAVARWQPARPAARSGTRQATSGWPIDAICVQLPAADLAEQRLVEEYWRLHADLRAVGAVILNCAAATLLPGDAQDAG